MRKVMTEPLRGQFHELSDEECLELLRSKRLGRVAYDDEGPVVHRWTTSTTTPRGGWSPT